MSELNWEVSSDGSSKIARFTNSNGKKVRVIKKKMKRSESTETILK